MAERGIGAVLDGQPFDNAISREAAAIKQFASPVAGHADIPLVSGLEAENMLARNASMRADADAAGIAGACVLMVFTSRADNRHARLALCAVAALTAHAWRRRQDGKLAELLSDARADSHQGCWLCVHQVLGLWDGR